MARRLGSAYIGVRMDTRKAKKDAEVLGAQLARQGDKFDKQAKKIGDGLSKRIDKTKKDIGGLGDTTNKTTGRFTKLSDAMLKTRAAAKGSQYIKQMDKDFYGVNNRLKNLAPEFQRFGGLIDSSRRETEGFSRVLKKVNERDLVLQRERVDDVSRTLKDYRKNVGSVTDRIDIFGKASARVRKVTDRLGDSFDKANAKIKEKGGLYKILDKDIRSFLPFARKLSDEERRLSSASQSAGKSFEKQSKRTRDKSGHTKKLTSGLTKLHNVEERLKKRMDALGNSFTKTLKKMNPFTVASNKLTKSWNRMDSTVRLVIGLILSIGPQFSALLAGLGGAATSLGAVLAAAVAGLAPLAGLLLPFAYGVGLAVAGLKDLKKYSPGASKALDDLKNTFKNVDLPAFMKEWTPALEDFFSTLSKSLKFDVVAQNLGKAFAGITNALNEVMKSSAWKGFTKAMEGPLARGIENVGTAIVNLFSAALTYFSAVAPVAELLSKRFEAWAENFKVMMEAAAASGELEAQARKYASALSTVTRFFGLIGDAIGIIINTGLDSGIRLLDLINGYIERFNTWMTSLAGQEALKKWFDDAYVVMEAVFELLGRVGTAVADLASDTAIGLLTDLLDELGTTIEFLGGIISAIGESGIINSVFEALNNLLAALEPLNPAIESFLGFVGDLIVQLSEFLAPIIGTVAGWITDTLVPAAQSIIENLKNWWDENEVLRTALDNLWTALQNLWTIIAEKVIPRVQEFWERHGPAFERILGKIVDVVTNVVNRISDFIDVLSENEDAMEAADRIFNVFLVVLEAVIVAVGWIIDKVLLFIFAMGNLQAMLMGFVNGIWNDFQDGLQSVKDLFNWFLNGGISRLTGALSGLIPSGLKDAINGIGDALGGLRNFRLPGFAAGGIVTGPTRALIGEAGPELIVPMNRPLNQVDPSVREISALIQGKAGRQSVSFGSGGVVGGGVTIAEGAIQVIAPESNPALVAESVVDRVALYYR